MDPILDAFAAARERGALRPPRARLVSNLTGAAGRRRRSRRRLLGRHLRDAGALRRRLRKPGPPRPRRLRRDRPAPALLAAWARRPVPDGCAWLPLAALGARRARSRSSTSRRGSTAGRRRRLGRLASAPHPAGWRCRPTRSTASGTGWTAHRQGPAPPGPTRSSGAGCCPRAGRHRLRDRARRDVAGLPRRPPDLRHGPAAVAGLPRDGPRRGRRRPRIDGVRRRGVRHPGGPDPARGRRAPGAGGAAPRGRRCPLRGVQPQHARRRLGAPRRRIGAGDRGGGHGALHAGGGAGALPGAFAGDNFLPTWPSSASSSVRASAVSSRSGAATARRWARCSCPPRSTAPPATTASTRPSWMPASTCSVPRWWRRATTAPVPPDRHRSLPAPPAARHPAVEPGRVLRRSRPTARSRATSGCSTEQGALVAEVLGVQLRLATRRRQLLRATPSEWADDWVLRRRVAAEGERRRWRRRPGGAGRVVAPELDALPRRA